MLFVLDEFTRRWLAVVDARRLRSHDVLQRLTDLFVAIYYIFDFCIVHTTTIRTWSERFGTTWHFGT